MAHTWLDQPGLNHGAFGVGIGPGSASGATSAAHLMQLSQLRALTPTPTQLDGAAPPLMSGGSTVASTVVDSTSASNASTNGTSTNNGSTTHTNNNNNNNNGEDELIPTAIVIKNIPFAVKKEQLVQLMTELNLPLPYAFNYHFDNGVFRGLAFANFTSAEETAAVIDVLNHYELHGRKLRVEYKKMLPYHERERIEREKREKRGQLEEQHRPIAAHQLHSQQSMPSLQSMHSLQSLQSLQSLHHHQHQHLPLAHQLPSISPSPVPSMNSRSTSSSRFTDVDMNDSDTLDLYTELFLFKQDLSREYYIFPATLSPHQRRTIHTLAHKLELGHSSRGVGAERAVHVYRLPTSSPGQASLNSAAASLSSAPMSMAPGGGLQPPGMHSDGRRGLNRAATIDFSEARAEGLLSPFPGMGMGVGAGAGMSGGAPGLTSAPRAYQSNGFLDVVDSPAAAFNGMRGRGGGTAGSGGVAGGSAAPGPGAGAFAGYGDAAALSARHLMATPNGGNGGDDNGSQALRAAKSFADLRSYSPSPALSTSSFAASNLQPNLVASRYAAYDIHNNPAMAAAVAAAAAANGNANASRLYRSRR
ncbi:hypothetical protein KEM52_001388 [Ascosphaera acerosa]|nr:hypothetical protein KEM52_001388 [Ascosphaera acerosa]